MALFVDKENAYVNTTTSIKKNLLKTPSHKPLSDVRNIYSTLEKSSNTLKGAFKGNTLTQNSTPTTNPELEVDELKFVIDDLYDNYQDILPQDLIPTEEEFKNFIFDFYPKKQITEATKELFAEPEVPFYKHEYEVYLEEEVEVPEVRFLIEDESFYVK